MSMFEIFDVAGQGMSAQNVRLNATASNIANANTVASSEKEGYRARSAVFQAIQSKVSNDLFGGETLKGVKVATIVESKQPLKMQYSPEHPQADENGYIYLPNVNVIQEMADMIAATRSYQANTEIFNATKTLLQQTINLGK